MRLEGSKWRIETKDENIQYILNTYRVLLTRARKGMIIYIPKGIDNDKTKTRKPEYFEGIYKYFKDIGIIEI